MAKQTKKQTADKKRDKAQDKRLGWRADKQAKRALFYAISTQG